jgi:hypothetical protein
VTSRYWFARTRSASRGGARMTPVSREGRLVVAGFVAAILAGGVVFLLLMLTGNVVAAVILYAAVAILAGGGFLWAAVARGDTTRTVADYRAMRGTT